VIFGRVEKNKVDGLVEGKDGKRQQTGLLLNMSISENLTMDASHDNDGIRGYAYGMADLAVSLEERSYVHSPPSQ
jgi:hypothetical protein